MADDALRSRRLRSAGTTDDSGEEAAARSVAVGVGGQVASALAAPIAPKMVAVDGIPRS
jgi:hypothetical protein